MAAVDIDRADFLKDEEIFIFERSVGEVLRRARAARARGVAGGARGSSSVRSWREAGEAGLLCLAVPEAYGGAGRRLPSRSRLDGGRSRRKQVGGFARLAAQRDRRALHPPLRLGGAEAAMAAEDGLRRIHRRHRDDRARRRLGPAGRAGPRARLRRQPLCHQRPEDLHQQRPDSPIWSSSSPRPIPRAGAKGISLIVVETAEAPGFQRGRNLDKIGMEAQDTSELFFNDVRVPTANLLGARGRPGLRRS